MTFLRLFSKMDDKNKITIPRGIRKELNIKPGDRLELWYHHFETVIPLTLGGINKAPMVIGV